MNFRFAAALLLIAVGTLVYLPGLSGGFAFDDYPNIVNNSALDLSPGSGRTLLDAALSSESGPLRRPVAMLSFALHSEWFDGNAMSFKIVNIAIHVLNALLIYALLLRLLPRLSASPGGSALPFAAALVWVVHPLNLTAVLYIVQRMTSLASMFMLVSILCYVIARERMLEGTGRSPVSAWIACALSAVLGVLTKETAFLLPFYLLVVEITAFRFETATVLKVLAAVGSGAALLLAAYVVVRHPAALTDGYVGRQFSLTERVLTEARALVLYVQLIILPLPGELALFHDDFPLSTSLISPPTTLIAMAAIAAILGTSLFWRRRQPLFCFAVWWFAVGHLLESTVIPLDLVYEHRNYLPSVGVLCFALSIAMRLGERLGLGRAIMPGAIALVFGAVTLARAMQWSDPLALALAEARHSPRSQQAAYELGYAYHRLFEREHLPRLREDARREFRRAIGLGAQDYLPLTALVSSDLAAEGEQIPADLAALEHELKTKTPSANRLYAISAVTQCQIARHCRKDVNVVLRMVSAAFQNPALGVTARDRILEWLGTYYVNALGDGTAALPILREISERHPGDAEFVLPYIELLTLSGNGAAAAAQLAQLPDLDSTRRWIGKSDLRERVRKIENRLAADRKQ